jgi:hypothetical protein
MSTGMLTRAEAWRRGEGGGTLAEIEFASNSNLERMRRANARLTS